MSSSCGHPAAWAMGASSAHFVSAGTSVVVVVVGATVVVVVGGMVVVLVAGTGVTGISVVSTVVLLRAHPANSKRGIKRFIGFSLSESGLLQQVDHGVDGDHSVLFAGIRNSDPFGN